MPSPQRVDTSIRTGRPWWQVCSGGCCLLLVVLVIGLGVFWRFVGVFEIIPERLDRIPANFPPSITLYAPERVHSIELLTGAKKERAMGVLFHSLRSFDTMIGISSSTDGGATTTDIPANFHRSDTLTLSWEGLQASHDEISRFYIEQFRRNGYVINVYHADAGDADIITAK